jgi:deoxyribodipyrimidine photo-lyase
VLIPSLIGPIQISYEIVIEKRNKHISQSDPKQEKWWLVRYRYGNDDTKAITLTSQCNLSKRDEREKRQNHHKALYRGGCEYNGETMSSKVPQIRIVKANNKAVNTNGEFVVYWMIAYRRTRWNYSLQRAVEWAGDLGKPLVILEALRCAYPWASDRLHRFVMDGMVDNARQTSRHGVLYYPYIELKADAGKGLLMTLADRACVIVTDDFPAFFIPRMIRSASRKLPVLLEQVDSNGILPMRAADQVFTTAYAFRRFLQKKLPDYLFEHPEAEPLKGARLPRLKSLPKRISKRWPTATARLLKGDIRVLASIPIDHGVRVVDQRGGFSEARQILKTFIEKRLSSYVDKRNQPEEEGPSGLSPYLHFGHISTHQIFHAVMEKEKWFFDRLSDKVNGRRSGWWGMGEAAEAFLDQLITWRELGFNMCWQRDDYDRYESLPAWALKSLKIHDLDEREFIYSPAEFEEGKTHDSLWNAAQIQLQREGRIHNYLRMLWGKKILEWTTTPRKALKVMIELNNRYALDGRDPNSYSGIFWVLGRYDRAWGPERSIFGKIRYMSSKNTARKVRVKNYIKMYAP